MKDAPRRPHHRTVDRVVELLGAATTDPRGLGLSQLAAAIDAPVSSVQKLVHGLAAVGLLTEHEGRYTVGPATAVLAHRAGLPTVSSPSAADLDGLHRRTGAAALLVVRLGEHAVNLHSVGLRDSAAYADVTRWRHPLHVTAGGRVLAAHLPEAQRRAWVADVLPDDRDGAMRLLDELQEIRESGVARGPSGPLRPDLDAVAAPVWEAHEHGAEVVAAVALAVPHPGDAGTGQLDALEAVLLDALPAPPAR